MNQDANKRRAAEAALPYIKDGIALGVGTGSTVDVLIELLQPLKSKLSAVVSSSERSTRRLAEFGIPTVDLAETGDLDLYIDGADEATKHRHLVKGGGGDWLQSGGELFNPYFGSEMLYCGEKVQDLPAKGEAKSHENHKAPSASSMKD